MSDALRAELAAINAEIDALYWAFTRQARAKPPVVVRPDLYRRRAEIEGALVKRSKPPAGANPCTRCGLMPISMSQRTPYRQTYVWCPTCTAKPYAADTTEAAVIAWNTAHAAKLIPPIATGNQDLRQESPRFVSTTSKEFEMTAQNIITARSVALSALVIECEGWVNPRTITGLDTKEIEDLGANIKLRGVMDPPKVQRVKLADGEIIELVIDGQRRVLAARDALTKNAPIPVVDLSEDAVELTPEVVDRLLDMALTSLRHEGLSSYELSAVAEGMAKRGRVYDEIGVSIGKSKSWVSRMLKARSTAAPKLMIQWRKGEITDEQFKELAEVADPERQVEEAKKVVEARKSGDKAEARVLSKEVKETARAAKPAKVTNGHHSMAKGPAPVRPVVAGEQRDLFGNAATAAKPAGPKPPSKAAIEDLLGMAAKRPPTADYVKGLLDGVRYSQGILEPDKFGKAWMQYVSRIEGRPRPAKKVKAKAAPRAKVKKAAKARKPAKKSSSGKRKR